MTELPLTPMGRILKNGGVQRISGSAEKALAEYFEDISVVITKEALKNAEAEGRKTLKGTDIEAAYKKLF